MPQTAPYIASNLLARTIALSHLHYTNLDHILICHTSSLCLRRGLSKFTFPSDPSASASSVPLIVCPYQAAGDKIICSSARKRNLSLSFWDIVTNSLWCHCGITSLPVDLKLALFRRKTTRMNHFASRHIHPGPTGKSRGHYPGLLLPVSGNLGSLPSSLA